MTGDLSPVELELARNRLEGIAEEVGGVLVSTAYSPNIKERHDCSAALFDADARCVAQAEHIPVHLGAMPASVEKAARLEPAEGDVVMLNDPFAGGTHLPDVTLVSPVFVDDGHVGYVATRAHHADVGGTSPGSMPADSRTVHDEGLRIPPVRLVEDGEMNDGVLDIFLANVRGTDERRADLRAQLSANKRGVERLSSYVEENGVRAFDALVEYAERRTRDEIDDLPDGTYEATERMDDGLRISVEVAIDSDEMRVDFAGTSGQDDGNLNAPRAVAVSAVAFVVRCVTSDDVPPNAGSLSPVEVEIPSGSVLDPEPPAAVAGGNVETSQRVVDAVVEALRGATSVPAQGQGTMNSVTVGNDGFSYYETVGGGAGASAERDGTDGVHVGMTNTLNTPVEALEREYPLRVVEYGLRDDSGGEGACRGGDGIVRAFVVLEDVSVSFLTDRRKTAPKGAEGGGAGATGENLVDGDEVGGRAVVEVDAGTRVELRTPGGGGYGAEDDGDDASDG
ncbi:MAG: hydantoinase B/oxoprolinase family protein [Halobacteriales archaeon]|nr:hydantoinase B/oxoprolinase family protein [Halobacteriales archaeon]